MSHYLFVKLSIAAAVRFFVLFLLLVNTAAQAEAPALLLAKTYNNTVNLNDYWVSEKLDGVRAYWDGNQLISRQGNPFNPPAWFIARSEERRVGKECRCGWSPD